MAKSAVKSKKLSSVAKQAFSAKVIALRTATSARAMLARAMNLGVTFGGLRDFYKTFGYNRNAQYEEMIQRYMRQDIVSRIVNAYPDAVWTRPPQIIKNEGLKTALDALDKATSLYHYINRADRLSGIGKYSVLFLGFSDVDNNEWLKEPVDGTVTLDFVQVYGYGSCKILELETDITSEYFGMPKIYEITIGETDVGTIRDTKLPDNKLTVHRTRIIHIADCLLDSDINGYPILERVFNRLDDIEKIVGGSAEMFWQAGSKGLQVDVDKDIVMSEEMAKALDDELEDYSNDVRRFLRTQGVKVNSLGGQTINPEPVFNVVMSIISTTTGIPQRIFIGSEQGKLASEQDRANWAIRINERRKLFAEPKILIPLISRLQEYGALPDGDYWLEWPEAFQMSPLERAQTAAQQARAATNIARAVRDYKEPQEGVDYPIRRPTKMFSGGGGGAFGGKSMAAANDKAPKAAKPAEKPTDNPNNDNTNKPAAPAPVEVQTEDIIVKKPEFLSLRQMQSIVFARGELKGEGSIDGVLD